MTAHFPSASHHVFLFFVEEYLSYLDFSTEQKQHSLFAITALFIKKTTILIAVICFDILDIRTLITSQ